MRYAKYYMPYHKMCELATNHYRILSVLSRFGIGLGFGDKTIADVCHENNVDVTTFLAIVNMLLYKEVIYDMEELSIETLLNYLHWSHEYFLDYRLPNIRKELVKVIDKTQTGLNDAILKYFDEYFDEVRKHMNYEEQEVFPYVRALIEEKDTKGFSIAEYSKNHDQVELKLKEFKEILIKYYPASGTNELNSVLFDIFICEYDLASHNEVENLLLVPAISALENKNA